MGFTACLYHTKLVTKLKVYVRCVECDLLDYLDAIYVLVKKLDVRCWLVGLLHNISVDSDKMNRVWTHGGLGEL